VRTPLAARALRAFPQYEHAKFPRVVGGPPCYYFQGCYCSPLPSLPTPEKRLIGNWPRSSKAPNIFRKQSGVGKGQKGQPLYFARVKTCKS
jgi:hypothetical protein